MAARVTTKQIVKDNDVAYTDKVFIEPISLTDFVNSDIVTPDPTEVLEYEDESGVQADEDDRISIKSGNGIDLFVDELPRYPDGYSKYPDNYKVTLPAGYPVQDAKYVAGGNPVKRPTAA